MGRLLQSADSQQGQDNKDGHPEEGGEGDGQGDFGYLAVAAETDHSFIIYRARRLRNASW